MKKFYCGVALWKLKINKKNCRNTFRHVLLVLMNSGESLIFFVFASRINNNLRTGFNSQLSITIIMQPHPTYVKSNLSHFNFSFFVHWLLQNQLQFSFSSWKILPGQKKLHKKYKIPHNKEKASTIIQECVINM